MSVAPEYALLSSATEQAADFVGISGTDGVPV
jgi:hypothetical protein